MATAVRIISKAKPDFRLAVKGGNVVIVPSFADDKSQIWMYRQSGPKDAEGYPYFTLVNYETEQALQHSVEEKHPVQLGEYDPNHFDNSIQWSQGNDLGDGYAAIRMANMISLNLDAVGCNDIYDGTPAVAWVWKGGDNQQWKITPAK